MTDFQTIKNGIPGQRWISQSEPELGLGILLQNDLRTVSVAFPATDTQRTYAVDNAPLTRIIYAVGDVIRNKNDVLITITVVNEEDGYITYHGKTPDGESQHIAEIDLDSFVTFDDPKEKLFAGKLDKLRAFELRQRTLQLQTKFEANPYRGLSGARIQLLPHQLYVANTISERHNPRVLLADEVGLGKTIEAALVIHKQLHSGSAHRVLIVVPSALVHQWLVELLRRFNLHFSIIDENNYASEESTNNPFDDYQLALCSIDFLTQHTQAINDATQAQWDTLIVDEAHHLEWSPTQASKEYLHIEQLSAVSNSVLLLSATPEQLGVEGHFARMRLLDPQRFHSFDAFIKEQTDYKTVGDLIEKTLAWDACSDEISTDHKNQLQELLSVDIVNTIVTKIASASTAQEKVDIRDGLARKLLDYHGTGRVLFRNTRDSITGFPKRIATPYSLDNEQQADNRNNGSIADIDFALFPEQQLTEDWPETDARAQWLLNWLKENKKSKVLLIAAKAKTALELEYYLRLRKGIRTSVFIESMSLLERDRAAAYFADDDNGAQILLCSEIGSEGRNFQFAHHLVLFDLPINPDLLEQRIGRLDRIGQTTDVQLHIPYYEASAQHYLYEWNSIALDCFSAPNSAAHALFVDYEEQLIDHIIAGIGTPPKDNQRFSDFIKAVAIDRKKRIKQLAQGRQRLLEFNSFDPNSATDIIESISSEEESDLLSKHLTNVFDFYGIDCEIQHNDTLVIKPSAEMLETEIKHLPEEGLTATFHREIALHREDVHFMSWEHPLTRTLIDKIVQSDIGSVSVCSIKLPPIKPGTIMVEAYFTFHCMAPNALELQRYVSNTQIRVLKDSANANLGNVIKQGHINKLATKIPKPTAHQFINQSKKLLEDLIQQSETEAAQTAQEIIESAQQQAKKEADDNIARLVELARKNPSIRQEELMHAQQIASEIKAYLDKAQFKLDGIRVIAAL